MIRRFNCPICEKQLPPKTSAELPHFPFCSQRCREVDLWRWADGKYAIVEELPPEAVDLLAEFGDDFPTRRADDQ